MDRRLLYIGAIPQDLDALVPQRNTLKALGWLAQGVFGTNTAVDGMECIPSVPADLSVNIAPGAIYELNPVDSAAFGSIAPDLVHNIVKQGLNPDAVPLTVTPPPTPGQAINYLVQAQILEQDLEATVLPYFNPASLINPNVVAWSGPSNSGVSQPVTRRASVQISLKPGTAATAGSQTTPSPDVGYVGLYVITVAQGQTQVTGASIALYDNAPFLWLKLPEVPKWVQGGSYSWAVDTSAVANQIVVELDPLPEVIEAGFGIRCNIANAVTGATTIRIKRKSLSDLGPFAVVRSAGSPIQDGDISANQVVDLVFDGTSFRDITGTTINNNVGTLTAQSGEGIVVDGDGYVSLNYPGLAAALPAGPDLFSFYSIEGSHHRVLTFTQLVSLFGQAGGIVNVRVFLQSTSYVPTDGATRGIVFAIGGGGAGGNAAAGGQAGGAGSGALAIYFGPLSPQPITIGAGGVANPSYGAGVLGGDGGTTSFGALAVAGGGKGGGTGIPSITQGIGGAGGVATAGLLMVPGNPGDCGTPLDGGQGGGSFFGGGGRAGQNNNQPSGGSAGGGDGAMGGGGGGGDGPSNAAGGKGGGGVVLVIELA